MNVYDSGRMVDVLAPLGFSETQTPEAADLIILNTCHIREKAAEKVYSELGRLRALKARKEASGGTLTIGVAGCVAQAEGEEIRRRAPMVDLVFGPQSYHRLPDFLARAENSGIVDTEFPVEDKFAALPAPKKRRTLARGPTAFLTIQEGCDKFCTFCVVPYTRGAEFSRPVARIEEEARALVEAGVRDITLLGQNVNAYHGEGPDQDAWSLARLVRRLGRIAGLERVRYTTSHPRDMTDDLIAAHGDLAELMPYLHLPVQSGSNAILAAMNRQHTADDYLRLIDRIRAARPDIALSSDFIVGFPGETEADFEATLALIRQVNYAQSYSFKYSPRPGTPAAGEAGQVPDAVKASRLRELQDVLTAQQSRFNAAHIGRTLPVLLDRRGRHPGQLVGRSPYAQAVHVDVGQASGSPEALIGRIVEARIEAGSSNSLRGHLAAPARIRNSGLEHER